MKDFAKKYIETYEGFSKIVKILLCLLWDIPSNLYRFSKSALKDNTLGMVLAVIAAIFGGWVLFVIDIITLAVSDKIYWLDELGLEEATEKVGKTNETEDAQASEETSEAADGVVEDTTVYGENDAE